MGVELGTNRKRREPQSDDKMERKKKRAGRKCHGEKVVPPEAREKVGKGYEWS